MSQSDLLGVKPINESLLERLMASHDSKRVGKSYLFNLPVTADSSFAGKDRPGGILAGRCPGHVHPQGTSAILSPTGKR